MFCLIVFYLINFELLWNTSHLLIVSLMLEYLRIFFPIFFALKEQTKVLPVGWKVLKQPLLTLLTFINIY